VQQTLQQMSVFGSLNTCIETECFDVLLCSY